MEIEKIPSTLSSTEQPPEPIVEQEEGNIPASPSDEQPENDVPATLPDGQQDEIELEEASASLPDEQTDTPEVEGEEEHTATTLIVEQEGQPEPANVPTRQRSSYANWVRVLAAILIVACLVGGGLSYALSRQSNSAKSLHSIPTPVKPLQVSNWCVASGPQHDPQAGQLSLNKIVAVSTNDAWLLGTVAQGDHLKNKEQILPVLEHWNGKSWTEVSTADTTALINSLKSKVTGDANVTVNLNDLAVLSANDIWAVGSITVMNLSLSPLPLLDSSGSVLISNSLGGAGHTLIEHWDGHTWQVVNSPDGMENPLNGYGNSLTSIAAVSANDIWAVGSTFGTPLVEHWNGTSWQIEQVPASLQHADLAKVQAHSTNDIWAFSGENHFNLFPFPTVQFVPPPGATVVVTAVAVKVNGPTITNGNPNGLEIAAPTPTAIHWDGQGWNAVNLPDALHNGELSDEAVISANDIWVVGKSYPKASEGNSSSNLTPTPVIQHWDGSQWSSVTEPTEVSPGSTFGAIAAKGANDIWLMGSTKDKAPLLEHWDGKTWKLVSPKSPASGTTMNVSIAGEKAWALIDPNPSSNSIYTFVKVGESQKASPPQEMVLETNC